MAVRPRKPRLSAEQRRALQLLASSPGGATEALMLAHGFTHRTLNGLVRAGLATWYREAGRTGGRTIEVIHMMITGAGRRAIEG